MLKNYKLKQSLIHSIFLFSVLITVYSFSYSGTFTTDDEHILASRTISMAFDDNINDYRVLGNSRIFSYFNLDPKYGQQSLNIEPMQAFLGSQLAKLANTFHLGIIQTIFFLNIFLTALTAVAIFWILVLLGYKSRTALFSGFIFGLCTIAWPYTKTYFRDPAAMLFVTLTWGSALLLISQRSLIKSLRKNQYLLWFLFGINLVLGILSKNTILLSIPIFILIFIQYWKETRKDKSNSIKFSHKIIISILILILLSASAIWLINKNQSDIFSRFSVFYYSTVLGNIIQQDHSSFVQGILGPIFSPGKSFFLFSPVLVLAIANLIKYSKKSYPAWIFFGVLILVQSLYYDSLWWGSINWGLRFLLPAVPIFILTSGQLIEDILDRTIKFPLVPLVIISFFIQAIGVWIPTRNYYIFLATSARDLSQASMLWNPKFSQIWWNFTQIISGNNPDFAFWRIGSHNLPLTLLTLTFLGLSAYLYYRVRNSKIFLAGNIILLLILSFFILQLRNDPIYNSRIDLTTSINTIKKDYSPGDTIFVQYGSPTWIYWMNWSDPNMKWISLSPSISITNEGNSISDLSLLFTGVNYYDNSPTVKLFSQISETGNNVWFVSDDNFQVGYRQVEALESILEFKVYREWNFSYNEQTSKWFLLKPH